VEFLVVAEAVQVLLEELVDQEALVDQEVQEVQEVHPVLGPQIVIQLTNGVI
tara:strand:+ start:185 stop:340 length:156 start_codon:yes stop_codon:yes gene_type:complete